MIRVVQRQNRAVVRTQAFSRGESFLTSRTVFRGHRRQTVLDVRPLFNRKESGEWGMGSGEWGKEMLRTVKDRVPPHSPLPIPHSRSYCDPVMTPFLKTSEPPE